MTITQLAWTTYHACKNAAGEYRKLSDEVKNLHIALDRLKEEAEKPRSLVRLDIERHSRTIRRIWFNCDDVLREVDGVIKKHESLGTSKKKLRDRLQFSAKDLGDIRSKIAAYTNVINVYIGIVGLSSLGRLEQQSHIDSERLFEIQEKIDKLATEVRVGNREGSILTTYPNDHKETWKAFRRSLLSDAITSDSLIRYRPEIKAYLMQLTKNGMLDEQAYDSDGNQEGFDNEPITNRFIKPAGVSETPSETSPSGKSKRISGVKVAALPQPEQPIPKLSTYINTPHPFAESTEPKIPSSTNALKSTLPYCGIGWQQEQNSKTENFPPLCAEEAILKKAVELTSALSEPAVNQRPSSIDASSPNRLQLHHHADGENRGPGTGPFTHSIEGFSPSIPSIPTPDAVTRPATEFIPVPIQAASDENPETSSVTVNNPVTPCQPALEFKPDTMAKPVKSDSITTSSTEWLDICPRPSTSDSLHARREPTSMRKDRPTSSDDKTTRDNVKLAATVEPTVIKSERRRERIYRMSRGREEHASSRKRREHEQNANEEETAGLRRFPLFFLISIFLCFCMHSRRIT